MDPVTVAVIVVLVSIVSSLFAYFHRKYSLRYWQSRGIPCVEPSFWNGNLDGVGTKLHLAEALKGIYDKCKATNAKYCGSYFYSRPVALLMDVDLMKDIWIKDFSNFNDRGLYYNAKDDPLSANLVTLDSHDWKPLRAKLTPTFTSGKMKYIFPTIVGVADRLRKVLTDHVIKSEDEVKIQNFITRYSVDVIGTTAFGIECNSLEDPNGEFVKMILAIAGKPRHSAKFLLLITSFPNIARRLGIKVVPDELAEFFMKVVQGTVEYREKNNIKRNDFMDILLELKNQKQSETLSLSVDEMAAQSYIFFTAGFETSSEAFTNCLYELAKNPDIQTKARELILKAFEKHNGQFTYEMIMDLHYIEQVIKETLRKYPLTSSLNRITKNDYRVAGTNHTIEKGTWIKIPVFAVHRDPEYYPDPEKFDPDRFESNEIKSRPAMTWIPFGDGPRGCIGARFSMLNIQIALTVLLKNFEFLTCSKTVKSITFNPKRPFICSNENIILKVRPIKM